MWPPDIPEQPHGQAGTWWDWHLRWFTGGQLPELSLMKRDKVIAYWQWYHWICWETSTYPHSCLLRSRVPGAHHHFPPLSPPWAVQVHGPCPVAPTTRWCFSAENQEACKQSRQWTSSGQTCLRTLHPPTQTNTKKSKHHNHYHKLKYMCQQSFNSLISLLWIGVCLGCIGFFNCSIITCISNISNTVAGAADICSYLTSTEQHLCYSFNTRI